MRQNKYFNLAAKWWLKRLRSWVFNAQNDHVLCFKENSYSFQNFCPISASIQAPQSAHIHALARSSALKIFATAMWYFLTLKSQHSQALHLSLWCKRTSHSYHLPPAMIISLEEQFKTFHTYELIPAKRSNVTILIYIWKRTNSWGMNLLVVVAVWSVKEMIRFSFLFLSIDCSLNSLVN